MTWQFDSAAFHAAELVPRQQIVKLEGRYKGLAQWLKPAADAADTEEPDTVPTWTLRALNAAELAHIVESSERKNLRATIVKSIEQGNLANADLVKNLANAMGISTSEVPETLARRLELFAIASVEPKITLDDAVRIAEYYPLQFTWLTQIVDQLTETGAEGIKKPIASG